MKLSISNLGIYDPIKNDLQDALDNLRSAKSSLTRPPAPFSQSGYMSGVPTKINDLIRKVTNLNNASSRINQKYKDYISTKKNKFSVLEDYKLKERIGLSEQFQMSSSQYNVNSEIFLDESGLLTFGAIGDATGGIKSALPGNGTKANDENNSDLDKNKNGESDTSTKKPDTMNINSDASGNPSSDIKNSKKDKPESTSGDSSIPGSHSPGTMDRSYQAQSYNLSPEEYKVLCATVYAEAVEGNDYMYSDAMGVTSSILNRVEAGNWGGSTVTDVVSAPNQFAGYGYGNAKFSRAMSDINCIPEDMRKAIDDTLAGNRNTKGYSFAGKGKYNKFR